jgi:hypothetical protein
VKNFLENFVAMVAGCLLLSAPFLLSAFGIVKG